MLPKKSKNQLTPSTWHTSCSPYLVAPHPQPARRHRVGSGKKADVPTPAPAAKCRHGAVVSTTSPSWAAGWAQQPSAVQPQGLPPRSWGCCHQGKGKCQSCWALRSQPTAPCWWSLATGQCYLGKEGATRTPPTRSQQRSTYSCACTKSYLAGSRAPRAQIWLGNTTDEEGWCRAWARQLLLLLLLLLVPPEVGLDGDGRLLGRVAEEPALAAGVRGDVAWDENRVSG